MKIKLTNLLLIFVSACIFSSCGDSKEKVANDMAEQMKKSAEIMDSGDKDAIAKFVEENNILEKRAKDVGIDINDPSTYPESLKNALAEMKSDVLPAAKDKAKEMLDSAPEIPESAKEMMKKAIDSAGEE